jgi:hypothetical protein
MNLLLFCTCTEIGGGREGGRGRVARQLRMGVGVVGDNTMTTRPVPCSPQDKVATAKQDRVQRVLERRRRLDLMHGLERRDLCLSLAPLLTPSLIIITSAAHIIMVQTTQHSPISSHTHTHAQDDTRQRLPS